VVEVQEVNVGTRNNWNWRYRWWRNRRWWSSFNGHQEQLIQVEVEVVVCNSNTGGAGGSGIVIVRGPSTAGFSAAPGTNTVTTLPAPAGGCKVATFTVSGTLTVS
jgi:hypothetical protein